DFTDRLQADLGRLIVTAQEKIVGLFWVAQSHAERAIAIHNRVIYERDANVVVRINVAHRRIHRLAGALVLAKAAILKLPRDERPGIRGQISRSAKGPRVKGIISALDRRTRAR